MMARQKFLSIFLAIVVFNSPNFSLISAYYDVSAPPSPPGIPPSSPSPAPTSPPPWPASPPSFEPRVPPKVIPPSPSASPSPTSVPPRSASHPHVPPKVISPLPSPSPTSLSPWPASQLPMPPKVILPSPSPSPAPTSLPPQPASQPVRPNVTASSPCASPSPASSPRPLPFPGIKGAYWPSWQVDTIPPSSIPTSYFTHFFYAFAFISPTSYYLNLSQFDEQWMTNFTSTLHEKSPSAKVLLSIGGAAANSTVFSNMASKTSNRAQFIISTIYEARKHGFDGLDLDWEFPNNPQDMSNLALLFKEWRIAAEMESIISGKPRLLISAAVYFASSLSKSNVYRAYPESAIGEYVDFLNPMCYDYHGFWNTTITGAHALLYDNSSNFSTTYGISSWKTSGMPSKKLVLGLPLYGRSWTLMDSGQHGIGAPAVGVGPGDQGMMAYTEIMNFNLANNATVVYDNETVSTYSYAGTTWIGYDDKTSIINKIKFAKSQGLGGYFFWALGSDVNWTLSRAASIAWDGEI